ncbi:potassium efflux system kefa protein / small-conductance mechanosensitive channel [hydrocarbon metagenome]|uniref:Potassium efflux system kefa protein / small-conductance mechanosensitive channel n=1 Tax=hydrocarbon metagenome TaxID=938273 RepID=A0A0W8E9U4_9ZZZZ
MISKYLNYLGLTSISAVITHQTLKYAVGVIGIMLIFFLINKIVKKILFPWVKKLTQNSHNDLDDKIVAAFLKPVEWLIILTGIFVVLRYLPLSPSVDNFFLEIYRSAVIGLIAWGFYMLADGESVLSREFKDKFQIDDILISFLSKVVRFVVLALALVIIAQEWGYEVNGFIAGLGLGGLAFALAAQDVLSNVFGGIVIIMEKPFSIGDWIMTPSVEGLVEDINFRSTRVRAFDHSLITVPNSTLAKEPITNYTRMGKRRIRFHLGVTYDTPRLKLEQCVVRLKEMLDNHPDVHPERILVYFEQFNDSSLDIFLYFFTNTTVWEEFLAVRQDINFKIMEILEELEISVAFPSHSIYFENPQVVKNYTIEEAPQE